MKLLLYCTKQPPYLYHKEEYCYDTMNRIDLGYEIENYIDSELKKEYEDNCLNGKIVAECDFEVEKITSKNLASFEKRSCLDKVSMLKYLKPNLIWDNSFESLLKTFGGVTLGYTIHIKDLHIFSEPRDLDEVKSPKMYEQFKKDLKKAYEEDQKILDDIYLDRAPDGAVPNNVELLKYIEYEFYGLKKAPQNMMYVFDGDEKKVLISIRPQWMCKIFNREKDVEVRKIVLKEMVK